MSTQPAAGLRGTWRLAAGAVVMALAAGLAVVDGSGTTAQGLPAGELASAILTSRDLPGYSAQGATLANGDDVAGCVLFQEFLRGGLGAGQAVAESNLQVSEYGPFIDEVLFSESAVASDQAYVADGALLRGCGSFTLGLGVLQVSMIGVPIDFGPSTEAIRADGEYASTIPVDAYLAIGRVDATTLIGFMYLQADSAADQTAYQMYGIALDKAIHVLNH